MKGVSDLQYAAANTSLRLEEWANAEEAAQALTSWALEEEQHSDEEA